MNLIIKNDIDFLERFKNDDEIAIRNYIRLIPFNISNSALN
jgi:hypothetical protein